MEKIYQLLYVSSSNISDLDQELVKLLQKAREKNKENGISGFLLFDQGNIIQLLEGEQEKVENLFEVVKRDPRHFDVIRMFSGEANQRDFPDWSMGFSKFDAKRLDEEIEGFNDLLSIKSVNSAQFNNISRKVQLFIRTFRQSAGIDVLTN